MQINNITVSIITVVYNGEKSIEKTILSVINQNYSNFEYIIIDGGSYDNTIKIIEKYKSKIDYLISEPDKGIYDAMNKGVKKANGEWIYFLNCGDVFYSKNTLENIFNINQKADLIYGKNHVNYGYFERINFPLSIDKLKFGMIFSHQSMFVKTYLMKKFLFSLNYRYSSDFDFIYKIYNKNHIFIENETIISSLEPNGVSEVNLLKTHLERQKIALQYEKGFDKLKLRTIYFFISIKIVIIKIIKTILPNSIVKKLTQLKYK